MAHNVTVRVPSSSWWVPYGAENKVSVYVKDDTLGEYDLTPHMVSWDFDIVNNRIAVGTLHLYSITSEEQAYLDRLNRVKVFIGNTILHVFQIKKVAFDTTQGATVTLEGIECKALRSLTHAATTYEDIASNIITNDLISGIFEQGEIDNLGKGFFRAEWDKKLKCLMNQADCYKADWWISWSEATSYNTDIYNIKQTRGSGSSLWTFTTDGEDQNIFLTSNAEDESNIINYVICLGAGNELTSTNYHATTNRTYLNGGDTWLDGAIVAGDTTITVNSSAGFSTNDYVQIGTEQIKVTGFPSSTSLTVTRAQNSTTAISHPDITPLINLTTLIVDDTSSFPNSGNVWVGSEKISYSAKASSTKFTITSRGVSGGVDAYAHSDNIEVWDAQYTTALPQTGSSIADNDVIEAKYDFRTIIDRNMLDVTAQAILAENRNITKNIIVIPVNYYEWLDDKKLKIGDTVTLIDSSAGLSGDYEIKRFHVFRSHGAQPSCEIELGKERVDYVKSIADAQIFTKDITSYAQGQYMQLQDSDSANCGTSFPLDLDIYIPKETIAIKSMNMYYNIDKYRVDSTVSDANTDSSVILNSTSSAISVSTVSNSFTEIASFAIGSNDGEKTIINAHLRINTSTLASDDTTYIFNACVNDGTTNYPDGTNGIIFAEIYKDSSTAGIGNESSHTHSHNHSPQGVNKFVTTSSDTISGDSVTGAASAGTAHTHPSLNNYFMGTGSTPSTTSTTTTDSTAGSTHNHTFTAGKVIADVGLDFTALHFQIEVPKSTLNKTLSLQIKHNQAGDNVTILGYATATVYSKHTHNISIGISEQGSTPTPTVTVSIDETSYTTALQTIYGTLSTSKMNEVDLSKVFTFEAGKRYSLSIGVNDNCWIHGGVIGEIFRKTGG